MYNATTVKGELLGVVGWRQAIDPDQWQLTDLLTSETGLYFQDVHPLVTIENLQSVAPEFNRLHETAGEINTVFTGWLQQKTEAAIVEVVDKWLNTKAKNRTAKNLLEDQQVFKISERLTNTDANNSKLVGFEILPIGSKGLQLELKQVAIQLQQNQHINLYVFGAGKTTPLHTKNITHTNGDYTWVNCNYTFDGNKTYFVVYDQKELDQGNLSINGVYENNYYNSGGLKYATGKFFKPTAFEVADITATGAAIWDHSKITYNESSNYGLNFRFSVKCDYTKLITEQKQLFKTAIYLQVGMNILRELVFNPQSRVNRNLNNISRNQILFEIDGDTQGNNRNTLFGRLESAINAIAFDNTAIDKICLPCRKRGVKYSSI